MVRLLHCVTAHETRAHTTATENVHAHGLEDELSRPLLRWVTREIGRSLRVVRPCGLLELPQRESDLSRKLMRYIRRQNRSPRPTRWSYADPAKRIQATTNSSATGH